MSDIEKSLCDADALFLDKLSRRMDLHQKGPELFFAIGRTISNLLARTGEIYSANYSLDRPERTGDETL